MRNISFALTTPQFKARIKDVTRRAGWLDVEVGEHLMGCEKCMGRKKGEPLVRLGEIIVANVRREPLLKMGQADVYSFEEVKREGFEFAAPVFGWPSQFVEFFCLTHKAKLPNGKTVPFTPDMLVTRIEFTYA